MSNGTLSLSNGKIAETQQDLKKYNIVWTDPIAGIFRIKYLGNNKFSESKLLTITDIFSNVGLE